MEEDEHARRHLQLSPYNAVAHICKQFPMYRQNTVTTLALSKSHVSSTLEALLPPFFILTDAKISTAPLSVEIWPQKLMRPLKEQPNTSHKCLRLKFCLFLIKVFVSINQRVSLQ